MKENSFEILKSGSVEEVKKLFSDKKYSLEFPLGKNALHYAVYNQDKRVIAFLLDEIHMHPDRPSETGITPLHEAATYGNLEAIRLLIEHGADYNKKDVLDENILTILRGVKKFDLVPKVKKIIEEKDKSLKANSQNPIESGLRNRNDSLFFFSLNNAFSDKKPSTLSDNKGVSDKEPLLSRKKES